MSLLLTLSIFASLVGATARTPASIQFFTDSYGGTNRLWEPYGSLYWYSIEKPDVFKQAPVGIAEARACDIVISSTNNFIPDELIVLKNPVLVIEGIDFDDENPPTPEIPVPGASAFDLTNQLRQVGILDGLLSTNHEVITLNFQHSSQSIYTNGDFVSQVLLWISRKMGVNPTSSIKVVGLSMGGLVARDAIWKYNKYIESNSSLAKVGLYLSFDSPHQGANIPLGLMAQLDFWADQQPWMGDGADDVVRQRNLVFYAPAPKEMRIRDGGGNLNPDHQQFQSQYALRRDLGSVRQVAITNGSTIGASQQYLPWDGLRVSQKSIYTTNPSKLYQPLLSVFPPNSRAFHIDRDVTFEVNSIWVPGRYTGLSVSTWSTLDGSLPIAHAYQYHKEDGISTSKSSTSDYGSYSNLNLDMAPGGYFPFYATFFNSMMKGLEKGYEKIRDMSETQRVHNNITIKNLEVGHTNFIPTVSGIDYLGPDNKETVTDPNYLYANLEALSPNLSSKTSFDAVYGVGSTDLSSTSEGLVGGFWKNQYHVLGRSEHNSWRVVCEILRVDGVIGSNTNCSDLSAAPPEVKIALQNQLAQTLDLRGNDPPGLNQPTSVFDRTWYSTSTSTFERDYARVQVWEGVPITGWNKLFNIPEFLKPNDIITLYVKIPSGTHWWMSMDAVLTGGEDGCGWLQLGGKNLTVNSNSWQKITWTVPSYYKPYCGTNENDPTLDIILNAGNAYSGSGKIQITGVTITRNGVVATPVKPLPAAKEQIIPVKGSSFALGSWGDHESISAPTGEFKLVLSEPWIGAVLYSRGVDISAYKYLDIVLKGSVPAANSGLIIFFDDNPVVNNPAQGYVAASTAIDPYRKRYPFISTSTLISKSADGYETRRIPLAWIKSGGTVGKIILQNASWKSSSSETWMIRSLKFSK